MKPESKEERMLKKTCFFAKHGRNNAGYECSVRIVPYGESVELQNPPRQASPNIEKGYTAVAPGYILTARFDSIIFGTPETTEELGLAWYSSIPGYEERSLLRLAESYYVLDRREQTGFLNWLIQNRQLVMLAHLLEMPADQLKRTKERAQIYYAARNRGAKEYQTMKQLAEGSAEQVAAKLRAQVTALGAEDRKIAIQKNLLDKAPAEMDRLRARSKYAVPDLVSDARRDLERLEETRARMIKSVEALRRELEYQMARIQYLEEFQHFVGTIQVERHG